MKFVDVHIVVMLCLVLTESCVQSKRYGYRTCVKSEPIEDDLHPIQVDTAEINPAVAGVLPVNINCEEPIVQYVSRRIESPKNYTKVGSNRKLKQQYSTPKPKKEIPQDNGWIHAGAWVLGITWITISPASFGLVWSVVMFCGAIWSIFFAQEDYNETPKILFVFILLLSLVVGAISIYYLRQ